MLKGVIFDLDGTITLTEVYHHRAFAEVFAKYGITYTMEDHASRFAAAGARVTFGTIFKEQRNELTEEELKNLSGQKRELYTKFVHENEISVVPGVTEFVKRIHDKGLKKIIATGNGHLDIVRYIVGKVGLLEYFPDMISVSEVARGKPFPDVFLEAAKRIDCEPAESVVLEDSVNGVMGAAAGGIRCIAFETTAKREDLLKAGASVILKNYLELTDEILHG